MKKPSERIADLLKHSITEVNKSDVAHEAMDLLLDLRDEKSLDKVYDALLELLDNFEPKDEIEGLLDGWEQMVKEDRGDFVNPEGHWDGD